MVSEMLETNERERVDVAAMSGSAWTSQCWGVTGGLAVVCALVLSARALTSVSMMSETRGCTAAGAASCRRGSIDDDAAANIEDVAAATSISHSAIKFDASRDDDGHWRYS